MAFFIVFDHNLTTISLPKLFALIANYPEKYSLEVKFFAEFVVLNACSRAWRRHCSNCILNSTFILT